MQIQYNEATKIQIGDIHFDLGNTRKKEPTAEYIQHLAESINTGGLIHPITYFIHEGKIQLICGWCRLKAATLNGDTEIEAREALTDWDGAKVLQFLENHDRINIDPLEERDVFNHWIAKGKTVKDIAALLILSDKYIYSRINLNNMIAEVEMAFSEEKFGMTVALEFCKLTPPRQLELYKFLGMGDHWNDIKIVRAHVQNISTDLAVAPFDTTDKEAYGGACVDCPKRSGCMKLLFPEIQQDDVCYDKDCFNTKIDEHFAAVLDSIKKRGDVVYTCTNRHFTHEAAKQAGFQLSTYQLQGVMPDNPAYEDTPTHIYGLLVDSVQLANRGMLIKILETHPEEGKKEETKSAGDTVSTDGSGKNERTVPLTKKDKAARAVGIDITAQITDNLVQMDNEEIPQPLMQWIGWEQFRKLDFDSACNFIKHFSFRVFAKVKDIKPEEIEGIYFRNVKDMKQSDLVKIVKTLIVFNLSNNWQYGCEDSRESVLKTLADQMDIDIQEICTKHKYE
jgi:ParB/RepB/Spo0J family partition protein